MAQCPKCFAPITDDFGLTECSACGAQLIVHIDGNVEFSGAGSDGSVPDAPLAEYAEDIGADESFTDEPVDSAPAYDEPYAEDGFESAEAQNDEAAAEPDDLFAAAPEDEFSGDLNGSAEAEPEEPLAEYPDFDEPEPPPPNAAAYAAPNDSPDLSDIADFGNSAVSGAREGALRYNVKVTGIDTVDVRDAFREALTDRKFVWDTDQIVRSIRDGECLLKDVTATKAHVLITRLRTLPVEIEWEQYAIHQA
jgi:hypothetical protein